MTASKTPLGDILAPSGQHRAGKNDYPVLSITMKQGLVDQADKFKKRVASQNTSNYRVAYRNELVVGFPIDEGVLGFQTKYPAAIVSPAYDIWRLKNESDCHIPYLERYLRSTQARHMYASRMQGAVARRRSLTNADFLKLEIHLPLLDDQIRIAHLLSKVEGLIAQRNQQLQQLDDLLKSVFLSMFGDPVQNEKEWPTGTSVVYSDLATVGVVVKPASHYVEKGVVALRSLNIKPNRIDTSDLVYFSKEANNGPLSKSKLSSGDVVIVRTGKTGTAAVVPSWLDGANCIDLIVVRPKRAKLNPQFLTGLLNSERGQALVSSREVGGIQKHFNVGALNSIPIPLPPIDLQNSFAAIVDAVESLKSRYQQALSYLEALYGALSQKAFKGELDLSRVPLPDAEPRAEVPEAASPPADLPNAIHLPDTELLLAALEDHARLNELLPFWLDAYRAQLNGTAFAAQTFLAAAQTRIAELHPDNDFELGIDVYDQVKTWVFAALDSGRLTQGYADADNCVTLAITAMQG